MERNRSASKNQNLVTCQTAPVPAASECIGLAELFTAIECSLKRSPVNVLRMVEWLREMAVRSEQEWPNKTVGYLTACWAFGALDFAALKHLEEMIRELS